MKQAIIDLAAAVNRLADAVEKITEKGGKEISPLIPPIKKGSQKESFLSSACARACEDRIDLANMFDEFWAAYPSECPRKVQKSKCRAKYLKRLQQAKDPSALHEEILAGIRRWEKSLDWTNGNGQFIKAPLVWLNNENWKDSPRAAASEPENADTTAAADRLIADGIAEILAKEAAR